MNEKEILEFILACRDEAEQSKLKRMSLNRDNFNAYYMEHDFSHKQKGQSQEILAKTRMAVEQTASFFQQALVDMGEWFKVEPAALKNEEFLPIKGHEVQKLTTYQLEKADYFTHIGNSIKSGLLGARMISKTGGELIAKPKYISKKDKKYGKKLVKIEDKTWRLTKSVVAQENYYPDPDGNLYEIEDIHLDLWQVKALSEGDNAIYDKKMVKLLGHAMTQDGEETNRKRREEGKEPTQQGHRPKVKITEFWGNILNKEGELCYENVVCTIANDEFIIRQPEENPLWHQSTPYRTAALLEMPNTKWGGALMDAPVKHEHALIETYNLTLDAILKGIHAISQIRMNWLEDPSQVSGGVAPGAALKVNNMCPPGMKVMEPVVPTVVPPETFNMMNLEQQEFNSSALTSDIRNGVTSFRQVKATEIVEANQTITSVFQGIAKNIESKFIQPDLELSWQTICQNWDQISLDEFKSLFGEKRGAELFAMNPADVFASTVQGYKFRVFGISLTINRSMDFRKWAQLLQTVGSSEVLIDAFAKKYDFEKLLGEVMRSLNLDKAKIEQDEVNQQLMGASGTQMPAPQGMPNQMSQVPQAGAGNMMQDLTGASPGMPGMQFPGSPATKGQ